MGLEVIIPIIVAVVGPLGAYLVAARRMSGQVKTSDASDLWREAGEMRSEYRTQLGEANAKIIGLEAQITALRNTVIELQGTIEKLRGAVGG